MLLDEFKVLHKVDCFDAHPAEKWNGIVTINVKKCLAGNINIMLATCCPDSQMTALLADISLLWLHKTNPDTVFLCR
jgi:hypothetical protein